MSLTKTCLNLLHTIERKKRTKKDLTNTSLNLLQ
jgi:hypothetical protein